MLDINLEDWGITPPHIFDHDGNTFVIRIRRTDEWFYIKTFIINDGSEQPYRINDKSEFDFETHIDNAHTHDDLNGGKGSFDKHMFERIKGKIIKQWDKNKKSVKRI